MAEGGGKAEEMSEGRWLDVGTAVFALAAAGFWFASAYGGLPPLRMYWGAAPRSDPFYATLIFLIAHERDSGGSKRAVRTLCVGELFCSR